MELTRTCCFEFDRKPPEGGKRSFLSTFCFYFMVACFTHRSPHPEVDKEKEKHFVYFLLSHQKFFFQKWSCCPVNLRGLRPFPFGRAWRGQCQFDVGGGNVYLDFNLDKRGSHIELGHKVL